MTRREATIFVSLAGLPFIVPHVVEDFAGGIAERVGLATGAAAFLLGGYLALQVWGIVGVGQGRRVGWVITFWASAVWTVVAGVGPGPPGLAGGVPGGALSPGGGLGRGPSPGGAAPPARRGRGRGAARAGARRGRSCARGRARHRPPLLGRRGRRARRGRARLHRAARDRSRRRERRRGAPGGPRWRLPPGRPGDRHDGGDRARGARPRRSRHDVRRLRGQGLPGLRLRVPQAPAP